MSVSTFIKPPAKGDAGKQAGKERKLPHLLEIQPVQGVVPHADGLGRQGGGRRGKADARHLADHLRLEAHVVGGEIGAAVFQHHVGEHDGGKLPKHVFTGGGDACFVHFFQQAGIQRKEFEAVDFVAEIAALGIEQEQARQAPHRPGDRRADARADEPQPGEWPGAKDQDEAQHDVDAVHQKGDVHGGLGVAVAVVGRGVDAGKGHEGHGKDDDAHIAPGRLHQNGVAGKQGDDLFGEQKGKGHEAKGQRQGGEIHLLHRAAAHVEFLLPIAHGHDHRGADAHALEQGPKGVVDPVADALGRDVIGQQAADHGRCHQARQHLQHILNDNGQHHAEDVPVHLLFVHVPIPPHNKTPPSGSRQAVPRSLLGLW